MLFAAGLFFQLWERDETMELDNIPARIYFLGGIALSLLGVGTLIHVLLGGTSDDAVATLVLLASGAGAIRVSYRLSDTNEKARAKPPGIR
jgi:hypothetical protein